MEHQNNEKAPGHDAPPSETAPAEPPITTDASRSVELPQNWDALQNVVTDLQGRVEIQGQQLAGLKAAPIRRTRSRTNPATSNDSVCGVTHLAPTGSIRPVASGTYRQVGNPAGLGLTELTQNFFGLVTFELGWRFPSVRVSKYQLESIPLRALLKQTDSTRLKFRWANQPGLERPLAFNLQLAIERRIQSMSEIWIVDNDIQAMLMYQHGFYACIAVFDEDTDAYGAVIESVAKAGFMRVHSAFALDVLGRKHTVALGKACEQQKLPYLPHQFRGARGHNIFAEFAPLKQHREQRGTELFRAQMKALALADQHELRSWATDPQRDLPEKATARQQSLQGLLK